MTFREKWLEIVDRKGSVLCAGLDPADFSMGRGEKGLPEGTDKRDWALRYVEAVAPNSAAVKPNFQYWKANGDTNILYEINTLAESLDMVVIDDSKLADIGSTNDAGIFYAAERADAVTFSPFAGNMEEAANQAHERGIGLISMCLMSNPEYEREKNKLVEADPSDAGSYMTLDFNFIQGHERGFVKQYIQLAHDAKKFAVDGVVIGAPSTKNHISDEEIERVRHYVGNDMLILLPGVGAQGGEAEAIWKYFERDNVIVNVGRAMMFPNRSGSTPEEQAETAREYRDMLNEARNTHCLDL